MAKVTYDYKRANPGAIVGLSLAAFLFAYVGGPGLLAIASMNTTGMDTSTVALMNLIPISFILAIVIMFLAAAGLRIE